MDNDQFAPGRSRKLLIAGIGIYVALLPYAIFIFNSLVEVLNLGLARSLPVVVILLLGLVYFRICKNQGRGFHVRSFLVPVSLILAATILIERNPVKYAHIPEYMLLTYLLSLALFGQSQNRTVYYLLPVYGTLLGVVDEIHQGIYPGRYFGWRDMVVNAAGSSIGVLALGVFNPPEPGKPMSLAILGQQYRGVTAMLGVSLLTGALSVVYLLEVADNGDPSIYPQWLLLFNCGVAMAGVFGLVPLVRRLGKTVELEVLLFWPLCILVLIHLLVTIVVVLNLPFQ